MKLTGLAMPPFHTTLMGVLKGALDFYGVAVEAPMVFGVSGHGFLINIHERLCPSGPYCWRRNATVPLIRNLGLEMTELGFFTPQSPSADRALVERRLREALDAGVPCSLLNLEYQLITGYDETGLLTAQPWAPKVDFPPARLTFGSWKELGDTFHVTFHLLRRAEPAEHRRAVLESLDYAVDLHANPQAHSFDGYAIGPLAYQNWIRAAAEHGASHGNWWNATVWSECRQMASRYFADIGRKYDRVARPALGLVEAYAEISDALARSSDKTMDATEKVKLLDQTQERESEAIRTVAALVASLRSGP